MCEFNNKTIAVLDEEIAFFRARILKYENDLDSATAANEKSEIRQLISKTLTLCNSIIDKRDLLKETNVLTSASVGFESPRLKPCVYVLAYKPANTFPTLLGTAWAVECHSQKLLLTAYHCLHVTGVDFETLKANLYLIKSIFVNDDGTLDISGEIRVRALKGDSTTDVAVLTVEDSTLFQERISLCPLNEYPSDEKEDRVKTYHCPIQSFPDPLPWCGSVSTDYTKVMESPHHYFVSAEHMHGSSGGVVVDIQGRAVALICSGYVPGLQIPLSDSFNTVWETMTALSDGCGIFTRCVKLSAVNGLYEHLREN